MAELKSFILRLITLAVMIYVLIFIIFGVRISPNNEMLPRVRAGDLLFFYRLENNTVEAIEILVNSDSKINNIPLKDLKIKKNLIIAYIVRNNVAIFPKGTDVINEGDRVIIITKESFFDDINNIVAE